MINIMKFGLIFFVVSSIAKPYSCESDDATTTSAPSKPDRRGRKYYDAEIYTGTEGGAFLGEHGFEGVPRSLTGKKYVIPYRHAGTGIMKKSGNDLNWNAWKGDDDNSDNDDSGDNTEGPKWQFPPQAWNNDAWVADPAYVMMLKNAMAEIKGENKPVGFLSKLTSDPALLLIAASIPISLLLAAVVPAVTNLYMHGSNIPTVTTTATGNKARSSQVDIMPYLVPIMEAVGTFGVRSISNPDCMQRIFCEVAQDKMTHNSKYLKKAATVARFLSHGGWLENFGVKELVDSLSSGNCGSIPCLHSAKNEAVKYRHSQKEHSNKVKK